MRRGCKQLFLAAAEHGELINRQEVLHGLPAGDEAQRVAALHQVLSDSTRTRILFALSAAELCVGDVASLVGLSVSAASHRL
jgi:DNA-binding transcriptional ArsR family regulator